MNFKTRQSQTEQKRIYFAMVSAFSDLGEMKNEDRKESRASGT